MSKKSAQNGGRRKPTRVNISESVMMDSLAAWVLTRVKEVDMVALAATALVAGVEAQTMAAMALVSLILLGFVNIYELD